ncbi:MAG: hypothetical protein AAB473_02385 [Patescibacteria group bacterium]
MSDWIADRMRSARLEEEFRVRIRNLDWSNWEDVKWRLDAIYDRNAMNARSVRSEIGIRIRGGELSFELALQWLLTNRSAEHDQRLHDECLAELTGNITTHAQRVEIMNAPAMFRAIPEFTRRRIMEAVLEDGDMSKLGIAWLDCFPHVSDSIRLQPVRKAMKETHAIEFLLEGSDDTVRRIDAWLIDRLESGKGAPEGASKLTAEFFAAAAIAAMSDVPKHVVVQLAATAILKIVGEMPWAARKMGSDVSRRPAHEQLKVLSWLIGRISGVMTDENAGIVLRWAMIKGRRHHNWVRERLTRAAESYGWRLVPVVRRHGELVAAWRGGRDYVARQSADPMQIGELREDGGRAWVPRERLLGEPAERSTQRVVYHVPLHPATIVTTAMEKNPNLFPL